MQLYYTDFYHICYIYALGQEKSQYHQNGNSLSDCVMFKIRILSMRLIQLRKLGYFHSSVDVI